MAQSLHWVIAALFVFMWLSSEIMMNIQHNPENTFLGYQKFGLYGLHKSIGVLLLVLIAFRILWRAFNRPPSEGMNANKWEKRLANLGHLGLYGVLVAMPLSGFMGSMALGYGVKFFGISIPNPFALFVEGGKIPWLGKLAYQIHHWAFEAFYVLIVLHILAALYHYYIKRDNVLQRMLPVRKP